MLGGLIWLLMREAPPAAAPWPTAVLWTATPSPVPTVTPTATPLPPPPPGTLGVGRRVQIAGTGGAGLSLRAGPGLDYERLEIADEGAIFIIAGGPEETDGLTWWLLKDEADPQREGWGAGTYLVPVE